MCAFASAAWRSRWRTLPRLKKTEKHNIDVVIDRIKVRGEDDIAARDQLRQRLAESFEAALSLADGRALVVEMDAAGRRRPRARRW